jgi:hypothetical protein
MIIYIGEGKNDAIFISSVLEKHFDIKKEDLENYQFIVIDEYKKLQNRRHVKISMNNGINKVVSYLKYQFCFIRDTYNLLVYGDNGRETIIKWILPKMLEILGDTPPEEKIKILCILDEDGTNLNITIQEIINKLKNRANSRSDEFIINNNEDYVTLQTKDDYRYSIEIHVFQIPDSLEVRIVRKGIDVFNIRGKQRIDLLNNDPHDSLNEIAKMSNISKEQLIERSVFEEWFRNDSWYQNLINKISSLNEFKTP